MTRHLSNIGAFVKAAKASPDSIVQAYCGLVAVELVLKEATGLKDHNVPAALNLFAHRYAVGQLSGCKIRLNSFATQLQNDLANISVQGKDQQPCPTPMASYPYIRYIRYADDGWPAPATGLQQVKGLASTVEQVRVYLKEKFGKNL